MLYGAGTKLGPYEIVSALGAGGMGEVYRARDTRLARHVAIKVLAATFSAAPDRLARFEQEARAAAALNHPNILAVFDIGTYQGSPYMVSELLEGDTLRRYVGAVAIRKAVEYAVQVANGLAAAHEKGIVHRDLKPENVFVTTTGRVKILDFGLAKLTETDATNVDISVLPTTPPATVAGTIMGTLDYMAPEQVRGLVVDHRADIFALGAILYELLSGRRAFRGTTTADTMTAILKEEPPDLAESVPGVPPALVRIIRRCLEKNAGERFHSAHDLAIAFETLSTPSESAAQHVVDLRPRHAALKRAAAALALTVALALAAFGGWRLAAIRTTSAVAFHRLTFRQGEIQSARFSPDGRTILYAAKWDNVPEAELYVTRQDGPESQKLPFAQPANLVAMSRSGEMAILLRMRLVRFYARVGTLARASISGGAPRELLENVGDADWGPDGSMAIARRGEGRYQLEYPIGKVLHSSGGYISDLRVSPDGRHVAFLDHPVLGDNRGSLALVDASGPAKVLSAGWDSAEGVAWTPSGDEVWFTAAKGNTRTLLGVTLDGRQRHIAAVPSSLTIRDIASDGRVLLQSDSRRNGIYGDIDGDPRDLSWFDWSLPGDLSQDGRTLLLTEAGDGGGAGYSVYLRNTDGSPAIRLGDGYGQALSRDGKWALVVSLKSDAAQLMLLPTGAGEPRPVTADAINHTIARFSSDARRVFFIGNEPGRPARVYVQNTDGGTPRAVTPENIVGLIVSPDDRYVVTRGPDQKFTIYPVDGSSPRPLRGIDAGEFPIRWSDDGRSMIVWHRAPTPTQEIYRVSVPDGGRELLKNIPIFGTSQAGAVGNPSFTADARVSVWSYSSVQSELFVVDGLK